VSFPIWKLEWAGAIRRRRLVVLNVLVPLLLVVPLTVGGAPAYHASAAYAVLFVFFGTFGSAIPLLRDGDGGPLRRIVLTGYPEGSFVLERALAGAAIDLVELSPALVFILWSGRADPSSWGAASAAAPLALLAANLIGIWVAGIARSIAEGALFATIASLFLLHGSGVFRTPLPGTVGATVEAILPYRALHEAFLSGVAGGPAPQLAELALPGALLTVVLALTWGVAPTLLERVSSP
jgi:hypothetical protein